jgi:hypothetical protein
VFGRSQEGFDVNIADARIPFGRPAVRCKCEQCGKRRKCDARELDNGVNLLCLECQDKVAPGGRWGWRGKPK